MTTATKEERPAFDAALDEELAQRTERALLAACLDDPAHEIPAALKSGVTGGDFEDGARGAAFDAVREMFAEGVAVDLVTVAERLNAGGRADAVAEVEKAVSGPAFVPHAAEHARNVLRRALFRRIGTLCATTATTAAGRTDEPGAILSDLAQEVAAMQNAAKGEASAAEIVAEVVEDSIAIAEGRKARRGVALPTPQLARVLGVLEPGLNILAARTSAGKSTVEGAIVRAVALGGGRVLRCFLDMPPQDLLARDLAALCFVSARRIAAGRLLPDEAHILRLAADAWKAGFGVECMTAPTLGEIVGRARAFHADKGLDLLTVDYAQNVKTGNPRLDDFGNANAQLETAVAALKLFAVGAGVPVLLLSQLNRAERDEDKRPVLSDLRGSGGLEQGARTVSFLYPDADKAREWANKGGAVEDAGDAGGGGDGDADEDGEGGGVRIDADDSPAWRRLALRPIRFCVAKNQQGRLGEVALRMYCPAFSIEDAALNETGVPLSCGNVFWERPGRTGANNPPPVIARDAAGRLGAFDPRFLSRVNAAAARLGFPAFEVVEEVAGGVAAVRGRLAAWREAARGAGA